MMAQVVLMARVDDPVKAETLGTRSTIVAVEYDPDDETVSTIVEMALEIAPAVSEWPKY